MDATLRIYSGVESVELPKSKRTTSPVLKIAQNGIVSVAKPNQDSSLGKPLAEISVPEKMQQVLIILLPKVDATDGLKFESKLFDLSSFKPGDWLFLNLTTSIIRVTEDGKSLEITAGSDALSKLPSSKEPKSYSISYDYKKKVGDDWSAISASSVVRQPERREICIFTEDPELETIDYHALSFAPQ